MAPGKQPHRHLRHIDAILDAADLPAGVRSRRPAVFRRLAAAEAEVHGSTPGEGALPRGRRGRRARGHRRRLRRPRRARRRPRVRAPKLPLGGGTVLCEHGRIPVPGAGDGAAAARGARAHGAGGGGAGDAHRRGAARHARRRLAAPARRLPAGRVGTGAGTREFPDHPTCCAC